MDAREIGSRLQLFLDQDLLESVSGDAETRLHHPTPRDRVLEMTEPWEEGSTHHGYLSVFEDDGTYRMYYAVRTHPLEDDAPTFGPERLCYAESADGIEWRRPTLDRVRFEGSTANNIVLTEDTLDGIGVHGLSPFKDTNPDCEAEYRYKALTRGDDEEGLFAVASPDGLDWKPMFEEPVITEGAFDSQQVVFWDAYRGEYRAYWRDSFELPARGVTERLRADESSTHRGIKTAVSEDFRRWEEPTWLAYDDEHVWELYTSQVQPYYRAPHLFVGFPARYVERSWSDAIEGLPEQERRKELVARGGMERLGTALTDSLVMGSRDGVNFTRYNESFLRPGLRTEENWFYGDNYVNLGLVETASPIAGAPDELSVYVSEGSRADSSERVDKAFRRYTLRVDGFVSLHGGMVGGECVTESLTFTGDTLLLNFSASAAGHVRVGLQDRRGTPIPGFELEDCVELLGDDLAREVSWTGGDVGRLSGVPVRLRFYLEDADVYSFQFR